MESQETRVKAFGELRDQCQKLELKRLKNLQRTKGRGQNAKRGKMEDWRP